MMTDMRSRHSAFEPPPETIRRDVLLKGSRLMLFVAGASMFVAVVVTFWSAFLPNDRLIMGPGFSFFSRSQAASDVDPDTVNSSLVGIVAGHAGYDPGAVCPDGLTEAEINLRVAEEVVDLLQRRHIKVDLLDEFDDRLDGYQADALVSIHADSCTVPGASGFKAARVTLSAIPEAEDQLVRCLVNEYGKITGLPEHSASITDNMTDYHAFREIASTTPGAIIETGFLLDDRAILERNPKLVARAIATGILCFLDADSDG
jgi:N-acetylmuramoyl-L-alanine amidase